MSAAESFWSLKLSDVVNMLILLATIFAIYFGPIRAVEISRRNDEVREAARRKREIFAALMRTRRALISPDRVWALNLIQVEFFDHERVIRAYTDFIAMLNEVAPDPGPALENFLRRRNDAFFDLLHEIAKVVGYSLDKRDLERGSYMPQGWVGEEDEVRLFRRAIIDLLHGVRPLPIAPFQGPGTPPNPFPPPPGGPLPPP
jgi:Family of unknown function (DUF6680)